MTKLSKRGLILGGAALATAVFAGGALLNSAPAEAAVQTGAAAPAFSVRDASGATRTLAEFSGRTVVLECWNGPITAAPMCANITTLAQCKRCSATRSVMVWSGCR